MRSNEAVTHSSCSVRAGAVALCALSVIALAACSPSERDGATADSAVPGHPVSGGTLVVGSISDVDSWNEYTSRQSFAVGMLRRMYLPLVRERAGRGGEPPTFEPALAESWSFSEDGTELVFQLGDTRWSDGKPVTASDVVFTWKAQTSPEVAWIGAAGKSRITAVTAPDPATVVFRFDGVYPERLVDAVEGGILPEHVFAGVPFERWRTHDWSQARTVSGPFLLERHQRGDEISLIRNPARPAGDSPWVDRIVVRIVPDIGNLLTQLMAGHIDYVEGIHPRDAERVRSAKGLTLLAYDHPKYDYIGWNGARTPFDDPDVRRALTLAIDRQALVEELLYGFGRVSKGPVLSFSWGADRELSAWPYDPDGARAILASAGYRPGDDGILRRNGEPLEFTLTTNTGNSLRGEMLIKIQSQLDRIGARVHVLPMEMRAWRETIMSGDFDGYLGGWVLSGRIELEPLFGSAFIPPAGANIVMYRSDELDSLLRQLGEARDWDGRKPVLDRIQRRIHEDQPYTFLYEVQRIAAAGPRVRNASVDVPSDSLAIVERVWLQP